MELYIFITMIMMLPNFSATIMRSIILAVTMIIVLASCSSEVKEQEAAEEVVPIVIAPTEESAPTTNDGFTNSIDENGLVKWYLEPDADIEGYRIEQHKWNKWVVVGNLETDYKKGDHYEFEVKLLVGRNIYRVNKRKRTKKRVAPVEIEKTPQPMEGSTKWRFNSDSTMIILSKGSMYEIFSEAGELVGKGTAKEIDISNLAAGGYYFNYALFMDSFQKK